MGLREVGGRSSARSSRMRIMSIVLDCDCQYPPPAAHNDHLNLKLIASTISLYYCRVLLLPADQGLDNGDVTTDTRGLQVFIN